MNLDLFIVNVAIPSIGRSYSGAGLADLSWVLNAYAIVFAALLVPAGRAADLIGRRAAFLTGMIVFGLASAACAAAPNVWVLVAARVVQAAGGALLMPASLGLLLAAARPEKRTGTIRAWTSVGGAAAALGPVLGGALVAASWHWVFLVNVPVVVIAVLAGLRVLPARPAGGRAAGLAAERAEALPDTLGAAVFTVAIGALALALVKSDDWGWASPATLGLIAAAAVPAWRCSSAGPPGTRRRSSSCTCCGAPSSPPPPRRTWCSAPPSARCCCSSPCGARTSGAGPRCAPASASRPGRCSCRSGRSPRAPSQGRSARARWPPRAASIYAAGCVFWRLNLSLTPDYAAHMLPGMLLTGTGVGLTLPTLVSAAVSAVPPHRFATGSGIVTMARQVGIVLGVSVLVTVLGHPAGAGALPAFQRATVLLAATAFTAGLVALLLVPARRRDQPRE